MSHAEDLAYSINGKNVFSNVNFAINKGDRIGLVGVNGIGKTTLLRVMTNSLPPTSGEFKTDGDEIGILPQDLSNWLDHTVEDFIATATGIKAARDKFEDSCAKLTEDSNSATLLLYSDALEHYTRLGVPEFDHTLGVALEKANLSDISTFQEIGSLSGGQRTRVALAALFASRHDVILLDEPTNNLDVKGIVVLENFIKESNASFVIVSHDRKFLRVATNRIIELVGGDKGIHQFNLGYDEYVQARESEKETVRKHHEQFEQEKKRLRTAAREANIRANSAGSNNKGPDNDKLTNNFRRQRASVGIGKQASSIATRMESLEEPERPDQDLRSFFMFDNNELRKKSTILTVSNAIVSIPTTDRCVGPVSLHLQNGERILLTGPNGSGKTTLLKGIVGQLPLTEGSVNYGKDAKTIYIDQAQTPPLPTKTAVENLRLLAPQIALHDAINLLVHFNLRKDIISSVPASKLSGGERAKILLAGVAASQANLLVLDEPTNNLDIPTVEALEAALSNYKGSVLMVSHDQDFIDAISPDATIVLS